AATKCTLTEPKARVKCGYPRISEKDCTDIGCCFDDSIPQVVWCYQPEIQAETVECAVLPKQRENCGYPGISMDHCYKKGCCFNSSVPDPIWCFYSDITMVM
ncbi:unnamed protein product, partial [Staurois parvus]